MGKQGNARWHSLGGMLATIFTLVAAGVAIYQLRAVGSPIFSALGGGFSVFAVFVAILAVTGLIAFIPTRLARRAEEKRKPKPPAPIPLRPVRRENAEDDEAAVPADHRGKVTPLHSRRRPPVQRKRR